MLFQSAVIPFCLKQGILRRYSIKIIRGVNQLDGEKRIHANRKEFALLAPLTMEDFCLLKSAIEDLDVRKAAAVMTAGGVPAEEEDILYLLFSLEQFNVRDSDIVRMTAHEHRCVCGGSFPVYDREGCDTFAYGARNALICLKDYPQLVKELILPESDLLLPEFRFAVLRAAMNSIPVRTVPESLSEISAVLEKNQCNLSDCCPHAVLHQVMNAGNIGAIIRSAVAFGIRDIALIDTATDAWDPEIISVSRCSSLGARVQCFDSIVPYLECYPGHALYPMMLQSSVPIDEAVSRGVPDLFSVILGNESRGLPPGFSQLGTAVRIPIETVNSLNVSAAAAVSFYAFTRDKTGK